MVGRLYRFCKVWQPSPLLMRLVQYTLIESTASADDNRTLPLVKTLMALYDHCHRKKRADPGLNPDPHDRYFWTSLASAGIQRIAESSKGEIIRRHHHAASLLLSALPLSQAVGRRFLLICLFLFWCQLLHTSYSAFGE